VAVPPDQTKFLATKDLARIPITKRGSGISSMIRGSTTSEREPMCGIFGVVNAPISLSRPELRDLTTVLLTASETRGSEAAGVAAWWDDELIVRKTQDAPRRFVQQGVFRDVFGGNSGATNAIVIGHARMVTNGSAIFDENNQPVTASRLTLVHNGIVTNFSHLDAASGGESDTVAMAGYLSSQRQKGADPQTAVSELFGTINGSATLALLDTDANSLVLATNTGSLYTAVLSDGRVVAFASERRILEAVLDTAPGRKLTASDVVGVAAGHGLTIDRRSGATGKFEVGSYRVRPDGHFVGLTEVNSTEPPTRAQIDEAPANLQSALERTHEFTAQVRRCSRCILPETVPFLEFDSSGICSQCSTYEPVEVRPVEELEQRLAPLRSSDGPNCVVAFSGGRDSAYGLHLLVREFGMKPITLTYDWGMVTDLARRNQARMTGALGVEHVLISADIAKKRRNIQSNLSAWMKNPDLGMVPLLMAGDKQFFLHARKLASDAGLPLVIFCINPLEATYFKSGFAGVPDQRYYTSSTGMRKAQLFSFYARQYLKNPRYINRSLADTMQATYATYGRSHDYLQLFEWVEWDEDLVNGILVDEYGWETDPTTTTTWRIGDGTAPFYNYVYWRTVGFTENDTFRSNQIREGKVSRDRALELVLDENEPRWHRIQEYLDLVDVDFTAALNAVELLAERSPVGR